jgi:hypothetical protein
MGGFAIFERNFRFGTHSRAYRMPPLSSTQRFCPIAGTINTMRKGQVRKYPVIGEVFFLTFLFMELTRSNLPEWVDPALPSPGRGCPK